MTNIKDEVIDILASMLTKEFITKQNCKNCPIANNKENCGFKCVDVDFWKEWAFNETCKTRKAPIENVVGDYIKQTIYECPTCKAYVFKGHDESCARCGQAIKWKD